MKKLLLNIAFLFLGVLNSSSVSAPVPVIVQSPPWNYEAAEETETFLEAEKNAALYEKTIAFIKKHEGFAGGKPYHCVAGYLTIGYGHVIKPHERFDGRISRSQADLLLRKDFNKCIALAEKHSENLSYNRLLAVAHFIYAKGIGRYLRSGLKKKIDNNEDPESEFLKWCKYHTPEGKVVNSKYSLKIRKWEISMFKGVLK